MSASLSAAQAAQQNNRGPGGQYSFGTHAEPEGLELVPQASAPEPFVAEPPAVIINGTLIINGETRLYDYKEPKTYAEASKALLAGNRRGAGKSRVVDLGFLSGKQPESYDLPVEAPRDGSPMVINNHGANSLDVRSGNVIVNVSLGYGGSVTVQPGATAEVYVGPHQKFRVDNAGGDVNVVLDPTARCYVTTKRGGITMVSGTAERSVVQGTTQFMTGNESMFREPWTSRSPGARF